MPPPVAGGGPHGTPPRPQPKPRLPPSPAPRPAVAAGPASAGIVFRGFHPDLGQSLSPPPGRGGQRSRPCGQAAASPGPPAAPPAARSGVGLGCWPWASAPSRAVGLPSPPRGSASGVWGPPRLSALVGCGSGSGLPGVGPSLPPSPAPATAPPQGSAVAAAGVRRALLLRRWGTRAPACTSSLLRGWVRGDHQLATLPLSASPCAVPQKPTPARDAHPLPKSFCRAHPPSRHSTRGRCRHGFAYAHANPLEVKGLLASRYGRDAKVKDTGEVYVPCLK